MNTEEKHRTDKELMRRLVEVCESKLPLVGQKAIIDELDAVRERLEQPEQEPAHRPDCHSLTRMLLSMPPQPAPCNCNSQPAAAIASWLKYDPVSDVLTIHGKNYSAAMFGDGGFLSPAGTVLQVVKGTSDEVVCLKLLGDSIPEWQPIATAPKDGTMVDLWLNPLGRRTDCYWGQPYQSLKTGWVDCFNQITFSESEYTHWMPLTAPSPKGGA